MTEQHNPISRFHEYCQQHKLGRHTEHWDSSGSTNNRTWHCHMEFKGHKFKVSGQDKREARYKLYTAVMKYIDTKPHQARDDDLKQVKNLLGNIMTNWEEIEKSNLIPIGSNYNRQCFDSIQVAVCCIYDVLRLERQPSGRTNPLSNELEKEKNKISELQTWHTSSSSVKQELTNPDPTIALLLQRVQRHYEGNDQELDYNKKEVEPELPRSKISKAQAELFIEYLIQMYNSDWKDVSVAVGFRNTKRTVFIGISQVTVLGKEQCFFSIRESTHDIAYGCETREKLIYHLIRGVYRPFNTFTKDPQGNIHMGSPVTHVPN